jgi:hypothetical protein
MKLNNFLNANTWLFLELVIITVVAWAVFEPAIVNLYYRSLPLGYDNDQLLYAETAVNGECLSDADDNPKDPYDMTPYYMTEERRDQILRQLMTVEGVESAYLFDQPYGSMGYSQAAFNNCCAGGDTLLLANVTLTTDAHFFETYGLKPLPGSPSAEELSHIKTVDKQVVLTRSGAIALFGTEDDGEHLSSVVGRHFTICYDPAYEVTVAGVVEDFRMSVPTTIRSMIITTKELQTINCQYVIRLKPGLNASRFVEEHGRDLISSGKTGFNRISNLMTFNEYLQQLELDDGRTQEVNRSLALALFFLVNLMLAVIGTVWLHAKRRTEECGVRRAFGATRGRLLLDFLWRNALLATAAVIIGCIIYLNYAHSGIQVYNGEENYETLYTYQGYLLPIDKTWVDYFWPHFLIISAVVYIVILGTVLIGTAIPAVKIIGAKITEALKDE